MAATVIAGMLALIQIRPVPVVVPSPVTPPAVPPVVPLNPIPLTQVRHKMMRWTERDEFGDQHADQPRVEQRRNSDHQVELGESRFIVARAG